MCGDKYGSETLQFQEAANFDIKVEGPYYKQLGPIYLCQNDMAKSETPPVDYFLNMCNMGWRWPLRMDEKDHGQDGLLLHRGKDPHCDAFRAEVDAYTGPGLVDVNCHMCHLSEIGKAIQAKDDQSQVTHMINLFWLVHSSQGHSREIFNFRRACDLWEENEGICNV